MTDPTARDRILTELAAQQTQQRQHHVNQLADLYTRITELRAALKTTEQTYRATYRRATTSGLITGPQLRSLGLPPIDARPRPRPTPTTATNSAAKVADHQQG